jgi:SAM-dependent methyltransferase
MHVQALEFVTRHVSGLTPGRVLEIGSLDINGSVRPLFPTARRYHGIDLAPGSGVDEVADAADWRAPGEFDVVVSTEVLEHAPRWADILANAWEAVAPGGRLLMTCATDPRPAHSAVDGWALREGEWYRNVPAAEVRALLDEWSVGCWALEVATDRGDLYLRADKPA